MVVNSEFNLRTVKGWKTGLNNLLSAEFGRWKTSEWYFMMGLWTVIINISIIGLISGPDDLEAAILVFGFLAGIFPVINVVIVLQDVIIGEKETGTAAWILSKPVSRSAYILSKLIGNLVGVAISMALVPGIVAYLAINIIGGVSLSPVPFFAAIGVLALSLIFYLTLTLMLGTFFDSRGGVIGIPMLLGPGYTLFSGLPFISTFHPMAMFFPPAGENFSFFGAIILGEPIGSMIPFFVTIIGIVVFTILALWRFHQEEL